MSSTLRLTVVNVQLHFTHITRVVVQPLRPTAAIIPIGFGWFWHVCDQMWRESPAVTAANAAVDVTADDTAAAADAVAPVSGWRSTGAVWRQTGPAETAWPARHRGMPLHISHSASCVNVFMMAWWCTSVLSDGLFNSSVQHTSPNYTDTYRLTPSVQHTSPNYTDTYRLTPSVQHTSPNYTDTYRLTPSVQHTSPNYTDTYRPTSSVQHISDNDTNTYQPTSSVQHISDNDTNTYRPTNTYA